MSDTSHERTEQERASERGDYGPGALGGAFDTPDTGSFGGGERGGASEAQRHARKVHCGPCDLLFTTQDQLAAHRKALHGEG